MRPDPSFTTLAVETEASAGINGSALPVLVAGGRRQREGLLFMRPGFVVFPSWLQYVCLFVCFYFWYDEILQIRARGLRHS